MKVAARFLDYVDLVFSARWYCGHASGDGVYCTWRGRGRKIGRQGAKLKLNGEKEINEEKNKEEGKVNKDDESQNEKEKRRRRRKST